MTTANSYCWYCNNCDKVFSSMAREDGEFIELDDRFFHEGPDGKLCGPLRFLRPGDDLAPSTDHIGIRMMDQINAGLRTLEDLINE